MPSSLARAVQVVNSTETVVYAVLHQGDFFGEIDVVLGTTRNATVKTVTYCSMLCLRREDLEKVLEEFPDLVQTIKVRTSRS